MLSPNSTLMKLKYDQKNHFLGKKRKFNEGAKFLGLINEEPISVCLWNVSRNALLELSGCLFVSVSIIPRASLCYLVWSNRYKVNTVSVLVIKRLDNIKLCTKALTVHLTSFTLFTFDETLVSRYGSYNKCVFPLHVCSYKFYNSMMCSFSVIWWSGNAHVIRREHGLCTPYVRLLPAFTGILNEYVANSKICCLCVLVTDLGWCDIVYLAARPCRKVIPPPNRPLFSRGKRYQLFHIIL